jgi:hypothetical protein
MRSILVAAVVAVVLAAASEPVGAAGPALLSGTVFDDLNGNGVQDPGEPGHASVTVTLDIGADGSVDTSTLTAGNGGFSFLGTTSDTYRLRIVLPPGKALSSLNFADFTPLGDVTTLNFALVAASPASAVPTTSPIALIGIALLVVLVGFRVVRST